MQKLSDYSYRALRVASVGVLAVALVAGLSLAPAQAQYGNYGYRNVSRSDVQRLAFVNGYADGYEHGIMDRRSRRAPNYRDAGEYRRGMNGYDSRWGYAREYQSWYRQSYSRGYMDGFNGRTRNRDYDRGRYPGWGSNPGYGGYPGYNPGYGDSRGDMSPQEVARRASQNGYNAGFQRGQWDAQQRARANPQGHGAFQFGLDGWVDEWGSASTYRQYYRQYFVQGYNDGFNRRSFDRRYYRSF